MEAWISIIYFYAYFLYFFSIEQNMVNASNSTKSMAFPLCQVLPLFFNHLFLM